MFESLFGSSAKQYMMNLLHQAVKKHVLVERLFFLKFSHFFFFQIMTSLEGGVSFQAESNKVEAPI